MAYHMILIFSNVLINLPFFLAHFCPLCVSIEDSCITELKKGQSCPGCVVNMVSVKQGKPARVQRTKRTT